MGFGEKKKDKLVKEYKQYYRCSNVFCDSVYHVSNFNVKNFVCRDCGKESAIPQEAREKAKFYKNVLK